MKRFIKIKNSLFVSAYNTMKTLTRPFKFGIDFYIVSSRSCKQLNLRGVKMLCQICNKETTRTNNRQKYCLNCKKEKDNQHTRNWRKKNKEYITEYSLKWRTKNRNKWRKAQRKVYNDNKETRKRKSKEKYHNKSKIRKDAQAYATQHKQRGVISLFCRKTKNLVFHHTDYENKQGMTLCKICHSKQHNQHKERLREYKMAMPYEVEQEIIK